LAKRYFCCGQGPDRNGRQLIARKLTGGKLRAPIDFGRLPRETPALIRAVLERCLDRNVRSRLRDIGEARVAIQKYLATPGAVVDRNDASSAWGADSAGSCLLGLGGRFVRDCGSIHCALVRTAHTGEW